MFLSHEMGDLLTFGRNFAAINTCPTICMVKRNCNSILVCQICYKKVVFESLITVQKYLFNLIRKPIPKFPKAPKISNFKILFVSIQPSDDKI